MLGLRLPDGAVCTVTITLPPAFPHEAPHMNLMLPGRRLVHSWLDVQGNVTGAPQLQHWKPEHNLGAVVADIMQKLAHLPPSSAPLEGSAVAPAGGHSLYPAFPPSSGGYPAPPVPGSGQPQQHQHPPQQAYPQHPQAHRATPAGQSPGSPEPPARPAVGFPELSGMDLAALQLMETDEAAQMAAVFAHPELKAAREERLTRKQENLAAAQSLLAEECSLQEEQARVQQVADQAAVLKARLDVLVRRHRALQQAHDAEHVAADMERWAAQQADTADDAGASWARGRGSAPSFREFAHEFISTQTRAQRVIAKTALLRAYGW